MVVKSIRVMALDIVGRSAQDGIALGPLTSEIGDGAVHCFTFLHGVQKWYALAEAAKIVCATACNGRCLHGASCLHEIVNILKSLLTTAY